MDFPTWLVKNLLPVASCPLPALATGNRQRATQNRAPTEILTVRGRWYARSFSARPKFEA